jgi:hypothetical protein
MQAACMEAGAAVHAKASGWRRARRRGGGVIKWICESTRP